MNTDLTSVLEREYQEAINAHAEDHAEAQEARRLGDMARYYDLMVNWQLPDICWALEKWQEAKHWYRHNARIATESRIWHAKHSGPNYPIDEFIHREASTIIKAGDLDSGRDLLKRAVNYWRDQPGSKLVLTMLGLHAAQAGLGELATYTSSIIDARQELPGGRGKSAREARRSLHYEPAEVCLLLGQWDKLLEAVKELTTAVRLVEAKPGLAFPAALQDALVAASQGLKALTSVYTGDVKPDIGQITARRVCEEAILHFYRFNGQVDWNVYFMRLNTRLADELAAGQTLNINPFADDWSSGIV